jgi:hypothetical protein
MTTNDEYGASLRTDGRVSRDDLELAAQWLGEYQDGNGTEEDALAVYRAEAWLRAEVARRDDAAAVRQIARATGGTVAQARAALAKARAS